MIDLIPFSEKDIAQLMRWVDSEADLLQFAGNIFDFPLTKEQLLDYIENPLHEAFVVMYNDKSIGHCEINRTQNHPRISRVLIGEKAYRGKGLAKYIITALLQKLQKEGAPEVDLNVYDWNTPAIRTYQSLGFQIREIKTKDEQCAEISIKGKPCSILNMVLKIDSPKTT
jgi:RimJ/RimL family protein N-acetyltransferase